MDISKTLERFQKLGRIEGLDLTQYTAFNKEAMESLVRMNELATSRLEQLLRLNSEIATEALENGLEMMRTLSSVKRPNEILASNVDCLSSLGRQTVENTQKDFDFCIDYQSDMADLVKEGASTAAEE